MAWESRGRGRYYYISRREDGRVVKDYIGRGATGAIAAGLMAEARRKRADEAATLAAERARLAGPERAMAELNRACGLAIEATLTAEGFHRCCYKWRRRHVRKSGPGDAGIGGRG
jgi:hypothetical protein